MGKEEVEEANQETKNGEGMKGVEEWTQRRRKAVW